MSSSFCKQTLLPQCQTVMLYLWQNGWFHLLSVCFSLQRTFATAAVAAKGFWTQTIVTRTQASVPACRATLGCSVTTVKRDSSPTAPAVACPAPVILSGPWTCTVTGLAALTISLDAGCLVCRRIVGTFFSPLLLVHQEICIINCLWAVSLTAYVVFSKTRPIYSDFFIYAPTCSLQDSHALIRVFGKHSFKQLGSVFCRHISCYAGLSQAAQCPGPVLSWHSSQRNIQTRAETSTKRLRVGSECDGNSTSTFCV